MDDLEPIMISALNHYLFCPRRCGLVHVEQVWSENLYTMRGNDVHENVDIESCQEVGAIHYERALPIWCRRLSLVGKADLVEFHNGEPYPVEYKSGRYKDFENDYVQLCAQALCLEEMFGVPVEKGALYWHGSRERKEIALTRTMRDRVEEVAASVQDILARHCVPPPVNDKRCEKCSLRESCLPHVVGEKGRSLKAVRELWSL
ncbi:CRISPR-associated protein Cas4 [Geobacter sp. DSM 9736]|uniref:CRISPR-associated protein Cas4 n=1 Tax=Geobacter sp. DSM 9736 TaxID=1277350 RepID=UPI000B5147F3|nr:CRISPR-associated protein Cas4 [Geobacter sp. DSM 9736]SNB46410.1 CRISPR-associated exonuclease, Cas4 family [Geobacter sp. DSM 9736]